MQDNAVSKAAEYRRHREAPLWRLLAAINGPTIIGILQAHFSEGERIGASALTELVRRDLEDLRAQGDDLIQDAQANVAEWVVRGYLVRRLLPGENEESYELSLAAAGAIRFVSSLTRPRAAATESRLATVVRGVLRLAEETDPNPESRLATLREERSRLDARIEEIKAGALALLTPERAVERAREIASLADELTGDFLRVSQEFENMNRDLRQRLVDSGESRGRVLDDLFSGIDLLAESEAGRAFEAFFRLLMDSTQRAELDSAIEVLLERDFSSMLSADERSFLRGLTDILLDRGGSVHETQERFARSLRGFVQSREYLEKRRMGSLIAEAQRAALALKESVAFRGEIPKSLALTGATIRSIGQWRLLDPSLGFTPAAMREAAEAGLDPGELAAQVLRSEIDYRGLKEDIRMMLAERSQGSVGEILVLRPARQGLGSVIGLVDLGYRFGLLRDGSEPVSWIGLDGVRRGARVPLIYFLKERIHELD